MYSEIAKNAYLVAKDRFETPLETIKRFRSIANIPEIVPITYAGRLDPMAYGAMILLAGDECKNKEKYTNLDKTYKTKIVFGLETDTGDVFGMLKIGNPINLDNNKIKEYLESLSGLEINQKYPAFSSKTFDGKQSFTQALLGKFKNIFHKVKILKIDKISFSQINFNELRNLVNQACEKIVGDFRYAGIKQSWSRYSNQDFLVVEITINASSGFYVRQFANDLASKFNTVGIAYEINRIKIGEYSLGE